MTRPDELAEILAADVEAGRPFRDLPEELLPDAETAHAVQEQVIARVYGGPSAIGGRKIAWNAPGQHVQLGLSAPGAGVVPRELIHRQRPRLRADDYLTFAMEPEIAAELAAPLPPRAGGHDRASVAAAIARLCPAFELLDPRGAEGPRPEAFIATNINNRGLVLGGPGLPPEAVDPSHLHSVVICNGEPLLERMAAAPMHPLDAAAFLANHFNARGQTLEAGEVLLLGTHMPLTRIQAPARLRFELGALGVAEFELS